MLNNKYYIIIIAVMLCLISDTAWQLFNDKLNQNLFFNFLKLVTYILLSFHCFLLKEVKYKIVTVFMFFFFVFIMINKEYFKFSSNDNYDTIDVLYRFILAMMFLLCSLSIRRNALKVILLGMSIINFAEFFDEFRGENTIDYVGENIRYILLIWVLYHGYLIKMKHEYKSIGKRWLEREIC